MEFMEKINNKKEVTESWEVLYKEQLHDWYCLQNIIFGEIEVNTEGGACGTYGGGTGINMGLITQPKEKYIVRILKHVGE